MVKRWRWIGSRLLQIVPVIVLATFIVFGLLQLVPGDPAVTLAGDSASPQRIAEIPQISRLDKPFPGQSGTWLGGAAAGDLSKSLLSGEPVRDSIVQRLPHTLLIVAGALLL